MGEAITNTERLEREQMLADALTLLAKYKNDLAATELVIGFNNNAALRTQKAEQVKLIHDTEQVIANLQK